MLVAVGGQSRNVGKTSVVAGLIAALPERRWTAVKITQFGHGICSTAGKPCHCAEIACSHPYALDRETDPATGTDTSRFLAAGAERSYWLRTAVGNLRHAWPALRDIFAENRNVILESNSILELLKPDLYLVVVDPAVQDFKASAQRYFDQADAVIVTGKRSLTVAPRLGHSDPNRAATGRERTPEFHAPPPSYFDPAVADFVRRSAAGSRVRDTAG